MTLTRGNDLEREKIAHTLGFFAKLLCSGTFVVGRDPEEFLANDLQTHLHPEGMPLDWGEIAVGIEIGNIQAEALSGDIADEVARP